VLPPQAVSATLDELLPLTRAWGGGGLILKMDMEGGECDAIRGAGRLLAEGRVVAVFMEAAHFGDAAQLTSRADDGRAGECDVGAALAALVARTGLRPQNGLNVANWRSWPGDVVFA
jgi:hypothetical protein